MEEGWRKGTPTTKIEPLVSIFGSSDNFLYGTLMSVASSCMLLNTLCSSATDTKNGLVNCMVPIPC